MRHAGDKQPRTQPTLNPYFSVARADGTAAPTAVAVACGSAHTFVLCQGGRCHAFGKNSRGQLGLQPHGRKEFTKRFLSPRRVIIGEVKVIAIDTPDSDPSHMSKAPGTSRSRATGASAARSLSGTPRVPGGHDFSRYTATFEHANITSIACGADHTIAISSAGEAFAVGSNVHGQLGIGKSVHHGAGEELAVHGDLSGPRSPRLPGSPPGASRSIIRAGAVSPVSFHQSTARSGSTHHNAEYQAALASVQLPGVVAFQRIARLDVKIVMAACGDDFTLLLSEFREVYSCGRGDAGQLGHGTLDNCYRPKIVAGMQNRLTQFITCRADQAVCVCRNGDVYWWGSGLRFRADAILLEGVKKEVMDARLEFSKALPQDAPNYMVASTDKSAPRFKQRVADYYKKRGVFAQSVIDALGIKRAEESLEALTVMQPGAKRRRPKRLPISGISAVAGSDEGSDGDAGLAILDDKGPAGSASPSKWTNGQPQAEQPLDMATSIMSLVPVRTPLPKDTKVLRLACGDDFYVALTEAADMRLSFIQQWRANTDAELQQMEVMKKFAQIKKEMEDKYGESVVAILAQGEVAAKAEAAYNADLQRRLAAQEQDLELRALMEAQLGHKLVEEDLSVKGWKSVIQAISDSLVYNIDDHREKPAQARPEAAKSAAAPEANARLPPIPIGSVSAKAAMSPPAPGTGTSRRSYKRPSSSSSGHGKSGKEDQELPMRITVNAGEVLNITVQASPNLFELNACSLN